MGMIKLLIATLLITSTLSAVCTTLEDVRCQSCKTENNTDSCVTCHMGYFKPAEGQTKAACVDPETKVDNCLYYSDKTTCSTCMAGYYLDTNKCVANTQDDCFAETNKKCTVCYGGFLPNSEGACDRVKACTQLIVLFVLCLMIKKYVVYVKIIIILMVIVNVLLIQKILKHKIVLC